MKKIKASKSSYASGSPERVKIEGGSKALTRTELMQERASMLNIIAAMIEQAGGRVLIDAESARVVAQEGKTIQIRNTALGFDIRFDDYVEEEVKLDDNIERDGKSFLQSDAVREAREFLSSRGTDLGGDSSGVPEAEPKSGNSN